MADINRTKDPEKRELCLEDMIKGIGRKATDYELIEYLSKEINVPPIITHSAFAKYFDPKKV